MALETFVLTDTRWKTVTKTTFSSTHTNNKILDVTTLVGYVDDSSKVNLVQVNWSVASGGFFTLRWGSQGLACCHLSGNGKFGGSNGMPAFINNQPIAGTGPGDMRINNAVASAGFVVCVFHKVPTIPGVGNAGWSA
jgi:hypothetical protein